MGQHIYTRIRIYNQFFTSKKSKKKGIFPDSQSSLTFKSNTMKNTVQIYDFYVM